jgi:hypothetical protein
MFLTNKKLVAATALLLCILTPAAVYAGNGVQIKLTNQALGPFPLPSFTCSNGVVIPAGVFTAVVDVTLVLAPQSTQTTVTVAGHGTFTYAASNEVTYTGAANFAGTMQTTGPITNPVAHMTVRATGMAEGSDGSSFSTVIVVVVTYANGTPVVDSLSTPSCSYSS